MELGKARESLTRGANGHYVVCEVLRLIYDRIYESSMSLEDKIVVSELLSEAFSMVKSMDARLCYYKRTYDDKSGGHGRRIPRLSGARDRLKIRRERKALYE